MPQVLALGQVLSQLDLEVSEPLHRYTSVLNIDIPAQLFHFECHGIGHDYYRSWWLSTVGQLAGLLLLVALRYTVQRMAGSSPGEASSQASSMTFFFVFLWCQLCPRCASCALCVASSA